jgi:hypothetical protein
MSSSTNQQRFRLQRGVETSSVGPQGAIGAKDYRIDLEREYDVYLHQAGGRELVGTCSIESGAAGSYVVEPGFTINFDPSDCAFWGTWDTDDDGVAALQHVWMTVEGA